MSAEPSPFAPARLADMPPVEGVAIATAKAGIKYRDRTDVLLMAFAPGTSVAGVFTTSRCASAPVEWCRDHVGSGRARALLVNSGNANAFTGMKGHEAVVRSARAVARTLGVSQDEVFLASTGVIGEPLAAEKFEAVMDGCAAALAADGWHMAARAIMTTDTFPKVATRRVRLGDRDVVINGIAKGAGMIAPDMATMLSFVATDAAIAPPVLQSLLSDGVAASFNRITVDSDTSTSDTLLAFATGAAGNEPIRDRAHPDLAGFAEAFEGRRGLHQVRDRHGRGGGVGRLGGPDRPVDRGLAAGEDRARRRGRQLGPGGDGGRQGRRAGRPGPSRHLLRRRSRRRLGCPRSRLRRGAGGRRHEAAGDRDPGRDGPRQRAIHRVDVRSHEGLRRDQRRLPKLRRGAPLPIRARAGRRVHRPAAGAREVRFRGSRK